MTIPLQRSLIYGPVNSRRLGRSLGINLLPLRLKICTFNCVYCQYGWTQIHGDQLYDASLWPELSTIRVALERALEELKPPPAYLTFSGNGEPTLHPHFPQVVDDVIGLRDRYTPGAQTAILSNASTVSKSQIRESLEKLDVRIMKLDCGEERCFRKYNNPTRSIHLNDIIRGLGQLNKVTIQSLFAAGDAGNYSAGHLKAWIEQIRIIKPVVVQLYTLDRGYPSDEIQPVSSEDLEKIKQDLDEINIPAEVYY
jgi:wyosine [tRNA(Phe)-imidazoG37] synthetase (radical SAM superfamily)